MSEQVVGRIVACLDNGELAAARDLAEDALAGGGADYDVTCLAGVLAWRLGDQHAGRTRLLQATQLAPERPDAWRHLGQMFASEGDLERAETYLSAALAAAPHDAAPLNILFEAYHAAGLAFSAKAAARGSLAIDPAQPSLAAQYRELCGSFPDREVAVYVPCYNAAHFLDQVLPAVLGQSYPITEVLVIDDGSTDNSVEVAARYPVRVITHDGNQGLSTARNTAILVAKAELLAHVDSDVVPDRHWLERLVLHFEAARLNAEAGDQQAPLGGVMGRLDELHDVALPDQWRCIHMGQHHGDERLDVVPHLYGCNSLWLRQALVSAGGYDVQYRTNGEDCDASERVRALGYRLAYEPAARCRHLRRDTLESVLRTIWRYHTPYYEYRFGIFQTGDLADVLTKLPENLARHGDDWRIDQERRTFHLLYVTFLGLPWRILADLKLAAELSPVQHRRKIEETQAAVFLGLMALLHDLEVRRDLLQMIADDLAPVLPTDESLRRICSWSGIEAVVRATHGERAVNPVQALTARDVEAVSRYLRGVAECWAGLDQLAWSMIRASAHRLRHEAAYRASVPDGAQRVALVNAPWIEGGRVGVRAGSRWPFTQDAHGQRVPAYVPFPFFLATAAAMLKQDGFDVTIVDAIAEGLYAEEFLRRLEGFQPDVVLLETATASHEIDLDWCLRLKERLGDQVQVVVAGPHATALGTALMDEAPYVDAIVTGEYEPSFRDLLCALRDGTPIDAVPGLIWRDTAGQVHAQPARTKLPPLSEYPWPERETLPMYNYFDSFANAMPWPNVQMHASRGCPFHCIFCVWPQVVYDGPRYRTRDNADIVEEMAWLVDRYGFRAVYFDDDTFNINNDRIIDLCDRIADRHLGVPICAMGRADTSNRAAFEAMKRAGLVGLKFGVETGDPEMMQRIRKGLDLAAVGRSVQWCKELGIGVHLTFSFGGPGETHETAARTVQLALDLDPDSLQFSLMTPFPGTAMFQDAVANGTLLTTDWKQFDGARYTVVRGEHLTREELEEVLRDAYRRWLLHLTLRELRRGAPNAVWQQAAVAAAEVASLADESLDLLQVTTPVEAIADLPQLLALAHDKVRPGGLFNVVRGDAERLPEGFREQAITTWQFRYAVQTVSRLAGCQNDLSLVLKRTRQQSIASTEAMARATARSLGSALSAAALGALPSPGVR